MNIVCTLSDCRASDADEGQNAAIRYALIGGNMQGQFSIDSQSGEVSLMKPLDYENTRSFRLNVRAQGKTNHNFFVIFLFMIVKFVIKNFSFFSVHYGID